MRPPKPPKRPKNRVLFDPEFVEGPALQSRVISRTSTSVENPLQISYFYAKQSQFPKSQMNVNPYITTDYENKPNWTLGENKPNSNPIKPNFRKAQMNVNSFITKDYRKKDDFAVRKNKPNLVRRRRIAKMNVNLYVIEDYENDTALRLQKNKPNSNPISKQLVGAGPRRPESAKMAQKIDVLKHQNIILEKSNFLYTNSLNSLNQHNPLTGTPFAYLEYMR